MFWGDYEPMVFAPPARTHAPSRYGYHSASHPAKDFYMDLDPYNYRPDYVSPQRYRRAYDDYVYPDDYVQPPHRQYLTPHQLQQLQYQQQLQRQQEALRQQQQQEALRLQRKQQLLQQQQQRLQHSRLAAAQKEKERRSKILLFWYNRAAKTIQRAFRAYLKQVKLERERIQAERQQSAAVVIQRWVRGFLARREVQRLRTKLAELKPLSEQIKEASTKVLAVLQVPFLNEAGKPNMKLLEVEENLVKLMIKVDNILTNGFERVRQERKHLISSAQSLLDQLDSHKHKPKPVEEPEATEEEEHHDNTMDVTPAASTTEATEVMDQDEKKTSSVDEDQHEQESEVSSISSLQEVEETPDLESVSNVDIQEEENDVETASEHQQMTTSVINGTDESFILV